MEFTKGYSKLDNNWFGKDGPLKCLTVDEKVLLIYLSTIIIMKSKLYEKCGLLHASSRADTIQKVCGFKNFRRWQASKGLDEKGIVIKVPNKGSHNIYLLAVLDPGYEKFGPAEKIVSMEKHLELRRMIEEIKPNPFVK